MAGLRSSPSENLVACAQQARNKKISYRQGSVSEGSLLTTCDAGVGTWGHTQQYLIEEHHYFLSGHPLVLRQQCLHQVVELLNV